MKALTFFALVLCLGGCAQKPASGIPAPAVHVKPNVAAIAQPVKAARESTALATMNVAEANARSEEAATIAREIVEKGVQAQSEEAKRLVTEIERTRLALFRAQADLRDASEKLTESEARVTELDEIIAKQTATLNEVEQQRYEALTRVDELKAALAAAEKETKAAKSELAEAKRALWWSKFKTWGVGIGLSALVVLGFAFRLIGAGARFA